jgi:hypothetical protein
MTLPPAAGQILRAYGETVIPALRDVVVAKS